MDELGQYIYKKVRREGGRKGRREGEREGGREGGERFHIIFVCNKNVIMSVL